MTRSKFSGLRRTIRLFPCLTEERELKLDLFNPVRTGVAIEPPPTFPFLESQCQRAPLDVNFHHAREATPPARQLDRARWAADIGAALAQVKRFNCRKNHVWCEYLRSLRALVLRRGTVIN